MRPLPPRPSPASVRAAVLCCALGATVACSGGGGGGGTGAAGTGFRVTRVSVPQDAVWQVNRAVEIGFNQPVDFASVSANSIAVRSDDGLPATGAFSFLRRDTDGDGAPDTTDETTIVFRPSCPTRADLSDAGLLPGGVGYTITLVGLTSGTTNTLRSADGRALEESLERRFRTPNSLDPATIFLDEEFGPPLPIVRLRGSAEREHVSYLELGGDPDPETRIYFELDEATQTYTATPGARAPAEVPLNLYADADTRVAAVLEFNQAIDTSAVNVSERRLRLEYLDASASWVPIETRVELLTNCRAAGGRGATVRLEPVGLLPPASRLRAVVLPGFRDLVGQTLAVGLDGFAVAPTRTLSFSSLQDADDGADEFFESFDFGGDAPLSFQDQDALLDAPAAKWEQGRLTAAFDFQGGGGPGGDFDWVVQPGEILVVDTASSSILGGPGGTPNAVQEVVGGRVDVRDLVVHVGGTIRVQGNNPLEINATGDVLIEGTIDVSGYNARDVATLRTGNQPEIGGAGAAGGGRGGMASTVVDSSTPRGGPGFGPFGEEGTGGVGGESAYAAFGLGPDARRPGGGGGGRLAADFNLLVQGLFAERGYPGLPESTGAETNQSPALGGDPGSGAFKDADPENDFFGVKPLLAPDGQGGYQLTGLVRGELTRLWAGYGGGGGGDAVPASMFPHPRWTPGTDEKGGGGGGGGGGLRIRALGAITFGGLGSILAEGAHGGVGENTYWLDHVGGTGGSGSGGHVVLESAVGIDLVGGDVGQPLAQQRVSVKGGPTYVGPKTEDAIVPCGYSHGGCGGPGVIQFHVPKLAPPGDDPAVTDVLVSSKELAAPHPYGLLFPYTKPPAVQLIPTFGARSKARSRWIALGGADQDPVLGRELVRFLFDGVETAPGPDRGKLLVEDGRVVELAPLVGPLALGSPDLTLRADGATLELTGAALDPLVDSGAPVSRDVYLRTPSLLRHFLVRVAEAGNPGNHRDFDVAHAAYDDDEVRLELVVDTSGGSIGEYTNGAASFELTLIPRYFRVVTGGALDVLPENAWVRVTLDAARDDGSGAPDESNLLVEEGTAADLNALAPGALSFFRFEVEFELDAQGVGITPGTDVVALEFLRLPFRF